METKVDVLCLCVYCRKIFYPKIRGCLELYFKGLYPVRCVNCGNMQPMGCEELSVVDTEEK